MNDTIYQIEIVRLTDAINWYKIGDVFNATYDPYLELYVAFGKGTAKRCVKPEDCTITKIT